MTEAIPKTAKHPILYIAHALYGNGTLLWGRADFNIERYLRFVALAMNKGYVVFSWYHHHATQVRRYSPDEAHYYMSRCKEMVFASDILWQCCPMDVSAGTRQEVEWAHEAGIPVVHKNDWDDPSYWPDVL